MTQLAPARAGQQVADLAPESGRTPALLTLDDYEAAARTRIDPVAWEYIASGAADEVTLRWNREAFHDIRLVPRQLRDVGRIDTGVRLLGHELPHPIVLAPVCCHRLVYDEGERATARGARAAGAGMVLSSYSTTPVDIVAAERPSPFWFQLYVQDRDFTERLIERVVASGASAIVVTVDTPFLGVRTRQQRAGFVFPPDLPHLSGARPEHPLTWKDLAWIAERSRLPLLLKGILHPGDVPLALDAGAAGLIVSNHGARNLDTCIASIEALPAVADAVAGRIPVLLDGGVRRGTDVLKALALGASAVMIGRPYIYGLAVDGAAGVEAVVRLLLGELELAMALCGAARIEDLDRSILRNIPSP